MSVLWPLRHLIRRPTARFYTLNTPAPAAVPTFQVALSLLPALLANAYPFCLVCDGQANAALGLFLWLFPWLGTGAIWTVMTQVSHAQVRRAPRCSVRTSIHTSSLCGCVFVCVFLRFVCVCVISHIIRLTPQQQSAESRNRAGAEALAVARRPKEASREKTRPPPGLLPRCLFWSSGHF